MKENYDSVQVPPGVDLEAVARHVPSGSLTRFAPAPTGWLHLGHVLNARYVWGIAQTIGGRVLLRIEDHDRERCRPEFETGILDDLDWLACAPDIFATSDFRKGRCQGRQSDRDGHYREAVEILRVRGLIYGCECSRKEILEAGNSGGNSDELFYPGTCRTRGLPLGDDVGWRVRLDLDQSEPEQFDDAMLGLQVQDPMKQCGDLLIRDRRGNWTYQFAVTVDDWLQGIDLVIRGRDLLASTGRQIRLARMLGRKRPAVFLHHPLIMKAAGQKLSKSDGDTGVRDLRAAGWTRAQVLNAARCA